MALKQAPQSAEMSSITSLSYAVVTEWGPVKTPPPYLIFPITIQGFFFTQPPTWALRSPPFWSSLHWFLLVPGANGSWEMSRSWDYCGESGRSTCEEPGIVAALPLTELQAKTRNHQQSITSSSSLCDAVKMMLIVLITRSLLFRTLPYGLIHPGDPQ